MESRIWFSHKEYRYDADLKHNQPVFHWTDKSEIWDWDNCTISAVKFSDNKIRIIVRSTNIIFSEYIGHQAKLRYMYGFDVRNEISEPKVEGYHQPPNENIKDKEYGQLKKRWVLAFDNKYWIWQWVDDKIKLEESDLFQTYNMLKKTCEDPLMQSNIFTVPAETSNEIIPVIYQPAIDSWKNYLQEIHCHKEGDVIEVSLKFRNETLRRHSIFERFYEWFRSIYYGRISDIETFYILLSNGVPTDFKFPRIHSGSNNIDEDTIHQDPPKQIVRIKYYFENTNHPIVFINTSNHAMAEYDNNHRLWKWEYVAWENDGPVTYGVKSRQELDKSLRKL